MVSMNEILDEMDAVLDKAMVMPLSGGKALINVEHMRKLIDDIRLHMPQEIRQARAVVAEHNSVIAEAKTEAEKITRQAEDRARSLVNNDEITRRANAQATETINQAQIKAREIRKGATDYAENIMRTTEDVLTGKLNEIRQSRQSLRATVRADGSIVPEKRPIDESSDSDE